MKVLLLGDIVGRPGRQALKARLPELRRKLAVDVIIANGENAAGGVGLTTETLREIFSAGVDVVTTGNHAWKHPEIYTTLNKEMRVLRPANAAPGVPGRGAGIYTLPDGRSFAVANFLGRTFMAPADCPFRAVEAWLDTLPAEITLRFMDMHAEATSEKRAMGWQVHGRVTALVGTHTHVQTADAMILPEGTAYMSDLGMCGAEASSVLGMGSHEVLQRFVSGLSVRFKPATGPGTLNGLLVEADDVTGKALSVTIVREGAAAVYDPYMAGQ